MNDSKCTGITFERLVASGDTDLPLKPWCHQMMC